MSNPIQYKLHKNNWSDITKPTCLYEPNKRKYKRNAFNRKSLSFNSSWYFKLVKKIIRHQIVPYIYIKNPAIKLNTKRKHISHARRRYSHYHHWLSIPRASHESSSDITREIPRTCTRGELLLYTHLALTRAREKGKVRRKTKIDTRTWNS